MQRIPLKRVYSELQRGDLGLEFGYLMLLPSKGLALAAWPFWDTEQVPVKVNECLTFRLSVFCLFMFRFRAMNRLREQ